MPRRIPVAGAPVEYTIEVFNFSTRQIQAIVRLAKPPYLGMSVAPDGRRLLYSQVDQSGTDLMLVENVR